MSFLMWMTRTALAIAALGFGWVAGIGWARDNWPQFWIFEAMALVLILAGASSFMIDDREPWDDR